MELVIGLILGVFLGCTGAGGTVIAVPLLVFFLHMSFNQAMGTALAAVSLSALYGCISKRSSVLVTHGLVLAAGGTITVSLGRWLSAFIDDVWLAWFYCFFCSSIAILLWTKKTTEDKSINAESCCKLSFITSVKSQLKEFGVTFAGGLGIGVLSGLLGVGGGVLMVPFLRCITEISIKKAVATSLFAISIVAGVGFASHLLFVGAIDINIVIKITIAGICGLMISHKVTTPISDTFQQKSLAIILIVISLVTLISTLNFF